VFTPRPKLKAASAVLTPRSKVNVEAVMYKPAAHASFHPSQDVAVVEVGRTVAALPDNYLHTNKVYKTDRFFKSLLARPKVLVSGCEVVNGTSAGVKEPLPMAENKPFPYKQGTVTPKIVITTCDQEPELTSDGGSNSSSNGVPELTDGGAAEEVLLPSGAAATAHIAKKNAFAAAASTFFDVFLGRDNVSNALIKLPPTDSTKQRYHKFSPSPTTEFLSMAKPIIPASKAMVEDSADHGQTKPVVRLPPTAEADAARSNNMIIEDTAIEDISKQITAANINDTKEECTTVAKPLPATVEDCDSSSASTQTLDHETLDQETLEGAETRKSSMSSVISEAHNTEVVDTAHLDRLRKEHIIREVAIHKHSDTFSGRAWLVERGFLPTDDARYQADVLFKEEMAKVTKAVDEAKEKEAKLDEERRMTMANMLIAEEALEKAKKDVAKTKKAETTKGKGGNGKKKNGKGRK